MVVNLNVLCKVHLNETGKQMYNNLINQLPEELFQHNPNLFSILNQRISPEGYFEGPLWEVMSIFGSYLSQTTSPFTSTCIELQKNPDFGNYFNTTEPNNIDPT